MTGRDNIDDAASVVASLRAEVQRLTSELDHARGVYAGMIDAAKQREDVLEAARAEVAAQRELLERAICAIETDAVGPEMRVSGNTLRVRDAIRTHLAGAAVPAEAHVFGVGDVVRVTGDTMDTAHGRAGDKGRVSSLADGLGRTASLRESIEVTFGLDDDAWVHPRDLVLARKAGQ